MGWDVFQCNSIFDTLVKKFFKIQWQSEQTLWRRLKTVAKWWIRDGICDENDLESLLKDTFGPTRRLFDKPSGRPSGLKVFVTATSISNADPLIFSNYNGSGACKEDCGEHFEPPFDPRQADAMLTDPDSLHPFETGPC